MEAENTRRTLIKNFILGTVASWSGDVWRSDLVLASESPTRDGTATVSVKLNQFPALAAVGGSVRLNVGLDHPIAINRGTATQTLYRNTVFNPNDPTPAVPLYVDVSGPRGFFSIALVVSEY